MRIAQVPPLMEAIPPKFYGGTERIVSYLTEELVAQGHEVTLFASGDSITKATLEPVWPQAIRLDKSVRDSLAPHIMMLEMVARRASEFDIIHMHVDYLGFAAMRRAGVPYVTTLHGRLDLPELGPVYEIFDDAPVVSISDSQRAPLPQANFVATIQHGLPERLLTPGFGSGGYAAFLGRISPEKAPDAAIRIAGQAGMKIKLAAKVDKVDQEYFDSKIRPLLDLPHVEFIGEIGEHEKSEFLGNAAALLFPIAWREPFGLVMIEAMACGTPVVAFDGGSVSEVIDPGITGFIARDENDAALKLQQIHGLERSRIRHVFEERFTARRMAKDYVNLYARLMATEAVQLEAV